MLFHQIGEIITAIISMAWHFTTKSDGIWDFPAVDDTEPDVVAQITDRPIGGLRQTYRLIMPPQQDMGIEEQPHASPSQKASGSGSSKSSAMTSVPCPKPAIRLRGCCAIWVSASSTSFKKC